MLSCISSFVKYINNEVYDHLTRVEEPKPDPLKIFYNSVEEIENNIKKKCKTNDSIYYDKSIKSEF